LLKQLIHFKEKIALTKKEDIQQYVQVVEVKTIHKKLYLCCLLETVPLSQRHTTVLCTFIAFLKHFIHLEKKYLDLGEEEKIHEKKKSLYLFCVLQTFHPFDRKKSSIREKKNIKKYLDIREEENIREKNKNLYLYCHSSYIYQKSIHSLDNKYSNLGEEEKIHKKNKSLYLYCVLQIVYPSNKKHSFIREKKYSNLEMEKKRFPRRKKKAFTFMVFLTVLMNLRAKHQSKEK